MRSTLTALCAVFVLGLTSPAGAVTQFIGDVDGFGFPDTSVLYRAGSGSERCTLPPNASGVPADTDGNGILSNGEFLPDLDCDGGVWVTRDDDFDNRELDELSATDGAQWTDRSLEPRGAAHDKTFTFTFPVPAFGDPDYGVDHFINFVFGDYDVSPAKIFVDDAEVTLTTQAGGQDGLVQTAFAAVPWLDMTDGSVVIRIYAPNEPYLAFDYALLDTDQIADCDLDGIPDPADNCVCDANPGQEDADGDGVGDVCDLCLDMDADDICDEEDNCLDLANPDQEDADEDGLGDACDPCPLDPNNDADGDGVCGDVDNCPEHDNPGQEDADGDGIGDACDDCTDIDGDGICIDDDLCADTAIPEAGVPSVRLGTNRWALVDGDGVFDTTSPKGRGPGRSYTIEETAGCSCEQIIERLGLGKGHEKFGCSISAMDEWLEMVSQ